MAVEQNKKIAIVCDWLTSIGGAERVLLAIHELYPEAPIFTSQYDPSQVDWFKGKDIRTTWLQKLPKNTTIRKLMPVLRRQAFEGLDLSEYDVVISSSGAEAKAVKKLKPGAIHITYCHSPTHYYWARYDEYLKQPGFGMLNPVAKAGLKVLGGPMRKWDYEVAQKPDFLIANSTHIQRMIKHYYNRESVVIHPPVDIERFTGLSGTQDRSGLIIAGRQVPYKRFDLAILAANKLQLPLTVIGDGPENKKLRALAGPTVTFKHPVSDAQMEQEFASAKLFLFPGVEDFGITPVEAMAAGTPIVAYGDGGALDYVTPKTGVLFKTQTVDSLCRAITIAQKKKWDHQEIVVYSTKFSKDIFQKKFRQYVHSKLIDQVNKK